MKAIAIDIDNVLNLFDETLATIDIQYDEAYGLDQDTFNRYLHWAKTEAPEDERKKREFQIFLFDVHKKVHQTAPVKSGAAEFTHWLKSQGWRVVIMTFRDLRISWDYTREWLQRNGIIYDYLFSADIKTLACKAWGIECLVEDDIYEVGIGPEYGIQIYYPFMEKHNKLMESMDIEATGYNTFEELKACLE